MAHPLSGEYFTASRSWIKLASMKKEGLLHSCLGIFLINLYHIPGLKLRDRKHFVEKSFTFEPPHEKTNNLHRRKQRRRSTSRS